MDVFIDNLAKIYFYDHPAKFGEKTSFLHFAPAESVENTAATSTDGGCGGQEGTYTGIVSGEIVYVEDVADRYYAEQVFVKYFHAEDGELRHVYCSMFAVELCFYRVVRPFFDALKDVNSLVPKFCASHHLAAVSSSRGVIMLEQLNEFVYYGYPNQSQDCGGNNNNNNNNAAAAADSSFLNYAHLSMMAKKIGEFHAYSFAAKNKDPQLFAGMHLLTYPVYERHHNQLIPILLRSLAPLRKDPRLAPAVRRLQKLVENLEAHTKMAVQRDLFNWCCILCLRSYTRNSVLFKYDDRDKPSDMKIIDWRAMGFASLAVDVGILLYIETDQKVRNEYWNQLMDDYYGALEGAFPDACVPAKSRIFFELPSCVPVVLYILAFKANQKRERTNASSTLWDENLITNVCKDFIQRKLV